MGKVKRRKGKKKIEKRELLPASSKKANVEIEYVQAEIDEDIPEEFRGIFEKFALPPEPVEETEPENEEVNDDEELSDWEKEDDEDAPQKSRKKLLKALRPTVAELKKSVDHPEVVEWWDVSAADPKTLIYLKSYRNTVPVPVHWSQKRKYLQGKRGIEKPPFELPSYIADTGIGKMREAVAEKESNMSLKSKMRQKMRPKLGKLSIDYQRLHDAFFRFQTKPRLTRLGDLYYEGKEFELVMKEKKPGVLSKELKEALGMSHPLLPPPWLLNMQRFGPPPSYPALKIPGLNAPIPDGAQWGYHPGGWGKPPVDEFNRPLYGDVFGVYIEYQKQLQNAIEASNLATKPERNLWGEITLMYNEDDDMVPIEEEQEAAAEDSFDEGGVESEPELEKGIAQPVHSIEIKQTKQEQPEEEEEELDVVLRKEEPKSLYTVLKSSEGKSGFMGSDHTYAVHAGTKRKEVTLAINPDEADNINQSMLEDKYSKEVAKKYGSAREYQDMSDLVDEHKGKVSKKRKLDEEKKKFKF